MCIYSSKRRLKLFVFDVDTRSERTFLRPNVNTVNYGEKSVRYFGPIVWDEMLPRRFKSIESLEKFKDEIGGWVPINCPCSLCREYVAGGGVVETFE